MELLPTINFKYPEYSVITPQTLQEFTIRSMNVQDEENFKASILNPNQFASHLNNILWACISKKPENIKTLQDFENTITVRDRDALLYGLYHISYKDVNDYEIYCNKCEKTFPVKIDISKCISINRFIPESEDNKFDHASKPEVPFERVNSIPTPNETSNSIPSQVIKEKTPPVINNFELLHKRIEIPLDVASNIIVVIKQPTLSDEKSMLNDPLFQSTKQQTIGTELLIIDRFIIIPDSNMPDSRNKTEIKIRDNMQILYKKLPSQDRKKINKVFVDTFGKYGIELKVSSRCNYCGEESESDIDLVSQFFRALYQ